MIRPPPAPEPQPTASASGALAKLREGAPGPKDSGSTGSAYGSPDMPPQGGMQGIVAVVDGELSDAENARHVVRRSIFRCYERRLSEDTLQEGSVDIELQVVSDGTVEAHLKLSETLGAELAGCIKASLEKNKFKPLHGKPARMRGRFVLRVVHKGSRGNM